MAQFTATLLAGSTNEAEGRVLAGLARVGEGAEILGSRVVSQSHLLFSVLVEVPDSFDRDATWVLLTSYGMSPSEDLGSVWQSVPGVGC